MEIHIHQDIESAASRVWQVVGDRFMHVGEWAGPVSHSCPVGSETPAIGIERECHTVGVGPVPPGKLRERLTAFDSESMSLAYEASAGMPGFVASATNRWSVVAVGAGRSRLLMHATFRLRGAMRLLKPLVRWRMRREARLVLNDLKHYVEHGTPHPRKSAVPATP